MHFNEIWGPQVTHLRPFLLSVFLFYDCGVYVSRTLQKKNKQKYKKRLTEVFLGDMKRH